MQRVVIGWESELLSACVKPAMPSTQQCTTLADIGLSGDDSSHMGDKGQRVLPERLNSAGNDVAVSHHDILQ